MATFIYLDILIIIIFIHICIEQIQKLIPNYLFWLITMFWIVSIMIIVGGLTRLTDSGLSITKWQLFSGLFPPLSQSEWISYFNLYKEIPEFRLQNYNMSLQEFKIIFWWEWFHRFLGRLIGIGFLIPLIYFSFKIHFSKLLNFYLIFFLFVFRVLLVGIWLKVVWLIELM